MKYKTLLTATLMSAALLGTSCKDEFADLNTNPNVITSGNISYLFAQGVHEFEPADYMFWYANGKYYAQFTQAFVPTGGNNEIYNRMESTGGQGGQVYNVLKIARAMDKVLKDLGADEAAKYQQMRVMLDPIMVYLGLFDTDTQGDIPYLQACMAPYTSPMLLTPDYDSVEVLYDTWLGMLNNAISVLTTEPAVKQTLPANQDMVYKFDVKKWAKLANSMKLKIAVRLLTRNKTKALAIAKEVTSSSAGIMDGTGEDFIFNKGLTDYHFNSGNTVNYGSPRKAVADFMLKNKDPRIRFLYTKNDYNSKVVQAFYDANKTLPKFIEDNVEFEMVEGKKMFKSWKGLGEPWVRYYGIPADMNAANNTSVYGDYFDKNRWKITDDKEYRPYSIFQQENCHGNVTYTLPVPAGGPVVNDNQNHSWYGLYMSTGEVNLYLAELKLLGADLPLTAQEYFNKGIKASVETYNYWAGLNQIPYYGTTYNYDPNEVSIELKDGEIAAMMANADYQLTGTKEEQLEKVYLQEYIHFVYQTSDLFVAVRRSGIPKVGSALIPWQVIDNVTNVPRRVEISTPSKTDLMYDKIQTALTSQGFTSGTAIDPAILNRERVWQDVGAPNWGEGVTKLLQ